MPRLTREVSVCEVATGVSSRSLRYYESLGLIRSERTCGGWRDFNEAVVERAVTIQHLFAADLCSATVKELPCLEAPSDERTESEEWAGSDLNRRPKDYEASGGHGIAPLPAETIARDVTVSANEAP
ncbi:DNA-binding transcriptional MerR regulator [Prauserella sediminis]|uniref:DNA-binding transcriptional MerR regulator n=1 Tax=Prauserella sediminis TaxID=577680 RepID=A0A839XVZ3_9PSEU|nr:MerR family transcriptional regulator [Prauserella sediminis]MBB3666309.1 DNA-binding transcriptional MerR regulator [Prauserella sediminis]